MNYSDYQAEIKRLEKSKQYDVDIIDGEHKFVQEQKANHRYIYDRVIDRIYYFFLRLGIFILAPFVLFFTYRLKIRGRKNLKRPKNQGAMIISNHSMLLDSLSIKQTVFKKVYFIGASFNNKKGFGGYTIKILGMLPLSNQFSNQKNLDNAIEYYLKKGKPIHIAPEQAMWRGYTKLRPFKNGAFYYAVKNNVPVIPMVELLKPANRWDRIWGRRFRATIQVLKPLYPNLDLPTKERIQDLKVRSRESMRQVMNEFYNTECDVEVLDKLDNKN